MVNKALELGGHFSNSLVVNHHYYYLCPANLKITIGGLKKG